jgi:predicted TIM-barrel fold metal-dependent hydrolase
MEPVYKKNGLPPVPDFHGGDANFTSVSYMAIPYAPMQTLATMIIDGVLERFPDLRIGLIELGASWVPGWMRSMDSAAEAFHRNEERLQSASLKPSEYVRRQVRVTPYPHESAGWIVREAGPEVPLFSSDYPHVEGGRNPLKRFEASLDGCSETEKDAFYRTNFEDLMGPSLDRIQEPVAS